MKHSSIMKKTVLMTAVIALSLFNFSYQSHAQQTDSIAAVVNNDLVTYTDLYDRMNLIITTSRMPDTVEFKKRLLPQVLSGLITEQLQLQKARELNLSVSDKEIDDGFSQLSKQNKMEPSTFKKMLAQSGLSQKTVRTQIKAQLAWAKVVQSEIRPRVILSDSEITTEVSRLQSRAGQKEYFVAEIFLPYGKDVPEQEVRAAARDLYKQLSKDPGKFPAAARQFSQNTTAAAGGIIGWVTPDQLHEDIGSALTNIKPKTLSQPIKTDEGYTLLFLRDIRQITMPQAKKEERLRIKIAQFKLPKPGNSQQAMENNIKLFKRDVKGCLDIVKRASELDDVTIQEYDTTPSNIPSQFVEAVENTNIGEISTEIKTENAVQIPMLCARSGGGNGLANIEQQIEERLGMQRMDILQKRYLRDLITEAYIERRV